MKRIVIPNEVRDLQFAVEENHASFDTLRNNSVSYLILGSALLYLEENPELDAAVGSQVSKTANLGHPAGDEPVQELDAQPVEE